MPIQFFHNPKCSQSRQALALLEAKEIQFDLVQYLLRPPSASELKSILEKLGLPPRALMRTKESVYQELGLQDPTLDNARLIQAMAEHPILIQRPLLVTDTAAAIGRPPESILEIL
jgi:arsenate reductase (glutaredoxin)